MPRHPLLLSLPIAMGLACATPTDPGLTGVWGGTEASMVLGPDGGSLNYSCGAGTVDSGWTLLDGGSFQGMGDHYFGGGPVPLGGRPPHPARYQGRLAGNRLTLKVIVLDLGDTLGPFHLERNGPPVAELCL